MVTVGLLFHVERYITNKQKGKTNMERIEALEGIYKAAGEGYAALCQMGAFNCALEKEVDGLSHAIAGMRKRLDDMQSKVLYMGALENGIKLPVMRSEVGFASSWKEAIAKVKK